MKKNKLVNILLVLIFVAGLSLLLYPTVSNYVNSRTQTRIISDYTSQVAHIDNTVYDEMLAQANRYNASLLEKENPYRMTEENLAEYQSLLNVAINGVMGYVEIPALGEKLALYHGTSDAVLQVGVGHVDWTSLPVGGESTHAVLSGHRGLPSAKLFTNLDKLAVGDVFLLYVLDEVLTYQVDQIRVVLPDESQELTIQEGKDLCTLVTCTPYGVNTHRLLVRGHRIATEEAAKTLRVTADAMLVEPQLVAVALAVPMLILLSLLLLIPTPKKHRR